MGQENSLRGRDQTFPVVFTEEKVCEHKMSAGWPQGKGEQHMQKHKRLNRRIDRPCMYVWQLMGVSKHGKSKVCSPKGKLEFWGAILLREVATNGL